MKQIKEPAKDWGTRDRTKENTITKEQDCNRIQDLQNHIQQRINDLSGQ